MLFLSDARYKKQSASIPAEDSGKQVLCVSFRGYLRPCDFANPAFGPLCISTEDCRCGQAWLHTRTYRCSRWENDWRLKKIVEKEGDQRIETYAMVNDQSGSILPLIFFFPWLRWADEMSKKWFRGRSSDSKLDNYDVFTVRYDDDCLLNIRRFLDGSNSIYIPPRHFGSY